MCSLFDNMHRYYTLIWDSEKKTLLGKNGVSWLSICLGTLVVLLGIGVFINCFREVKKSRQESDALLRKVLLEKLKLSSAPASTSTSMPSNGCLRTPLTRSSNPTVVTDRSNETLEELIDQDFKYFEYMQINKPLVRKKRIVTDEQAASFNMRRLQAVNTRLLEKQLESKSTTISIESEVPPTTFREQFAERGIETVFGNRVETIPFENAGADTKMDTKIEREKFVDERSEASPMRHSVQFTSGDNAFSKKLAKTEVKRLKRQEGTIENKTSYFYIHKLANTKVKRFQRKELTAAKKLKDPSFLEKLPKARVELEKSTPIYIESEIILTTPEEKISEIGIERKFGNSVEKFPSGDGDSDKKLIKTTKIVDKRSEALPMSHSAEFKNNDNVFPKNISKAKVKHLKRQERIAEVKNDYKSVIKEPANTKSERMQRKELTAEEKLKDTIFLEKLAKARVERLKKQEPAVNVIEEVFHTNSKTFKDAASTIIDDVESIDKDSKNVLNKTRFGSFIRKPLKRLKNIYQLPSVPHKFLKRTFSRLNQRILEPNVTARKDIFQQVKEKIRNSKRFSAITSPIEDTLDSRGLRDFKSYSLIPNNLLSEAGKSMSTKINILVDKISTIKLQPKIIRSSSYYLVNDANTSSKYSSTFTSLPEDKTEIKSVSASASTESPQLGAGGFERITRL